MLFPTPLRLFVAAFLFIATADKLFAQTKPALTDGRRTAACTQCESLLQKMPKEVMFGVQLNNNGDVYFSMSNKDWFNKIFTGNRDGIAVDLVSKDQYDCNRTLPGTGFGKGEVMQPVYLPELKKNMQDMGEGHFAVKIGHIPPQLAKKELEGNLAILRNGIVCFYTNFVDIERTQWELLPMGLYTDTVINYQPYHDTGTVNEHLFYTKKLQFTIPFLKNKTQYNTADIKPVYDSLQLAGYSIKSITIRAYSSVEGSVQVNAQLQQQRALSIVKALQQFQSPEIKTHISTGENWIEFYNDMGKSPLPQLASLSKPEIRQKLLDKTVLDQLEPYLKNHRKAIITIYLNRKTGFEKSDNNTLLSQFKKAIEVKRSTEASIIQDAIFERIADGKLPQEFMYKLEVPNEKIFSDLKNNQVTYKYLLQLSDEAGALEELKEIEKVAPANGRVKYNICVLTFSFWKEDSSYTNAADFLRYIKALPGLGIHASLVKRMLVNYFIVMSDIYLQRYNYDAKDNALDSIKSNYTTINLSDEEVLALAKFLCYYSQCDWSEELLEKRVGRIDVDEDLLFYYINLRLFNPASFQVAYIKQAALNAISINRKRFCHFFNATGNGGASFQLLDHAALRALYCENCAP